MDILSLSTISHFPCSPIPFTGAAAATTTTTSISFSLNPPPPPEPTNPRNSPSLRRPKSLNSIPTRPSTPPPKIIKNPLKSLLNPSSPPPKTTTTTPITNLHPFSNKLWLSSKLATPPPPPPPPPPQETFIPETKKSLENKPQDNETQEHETPKPEFVQKGKIFVGNLPNWIKKHQVSEFFRQFGPIKNVILIKGHNEAERNAGFGFIIYDDATAEKSAMKAVEFDGVEFHGRVLTVKLDDGKRLRGKFEERKRWMEGEEGEEYRSKWHEEREGSRNAFLKVLETKPENWQAVVSAFERIKKV